jgi:hypothetical protein
MTVQACEAPVSSALGRAKVDTAYFRDAYRAPLTHDQSVVDIFFAIFGYRPAWMNAALIARNRAASLFGLKAPSAQELLHRTRSHDYAVGERIGTWPIHTLTETELIAGLDDKHLDFRLSILIEDGSESRSVVVSTVCNVHNTFGKLYLLFVIPFHKWGVQLLIRRAVAAGRL